MARMVEVVIDSVRVSLTNQQRIVVLRQVDTERYLPIWIGMYEAESITVALQEVEVARPQTHDLLKSVFGMLNAHIQRVEVVSLREDVFYGSIVADRDGEVVEIDCRPSDAIALAVRAHVPILVARDIMESAGIVAEPDVSASGESQAAQPPRSAAGDEPPGETNEERLSVFEDFLQNLNLKDLPDSEEDEDDGEDSEEPPSAGVV